MDEYAASFWKDIEVRIDPDPFCTSCHISSMKKGYIQEPIKAKSIFQMSVWI